MERGRRRRRGHPAHLRHHRQAQGRHAHPRQSGPQRRGQRPHPGRDRAGRRGDGLPAAVPRLRPDLRSQRCGPGRRDVDADPPVRPAQGARGDRARPGHGVRGGADDVFGAAQRGRRGLRRGDAQPADLCLRRRGAARPGSHRLRKGLWLRRSRGLRALRELSGGRVQSSEPGAQGGLDRHPDRRRRDAGGRPGRSRGPAGGDGRDPDPRPQRDEGLLEPARRHQGHDHRRGLAEHRRRRTHRRGRLLLHRRPHQGHDHPRRLQRLSPRDRGGALRAPGGGRSRRHRHPARLPRRGSRRRGRAQERRRRRHPTSCATTSRPGWPLTSIRARSGSSTRCPKAPPARSRNATSPFRQPKAHDNHGKNLESQGRHHQSRRAGRTARPAAHQRHQALRQPDDAERHLGPLRRQPRPAPRRGGRPGRHADP